MTRNRNKRLIILRGLPGSGKSSLAEEIMEDYEYSGEIFSADDFLKDENGDWLLNIDNELLQNAHEETRRGVSNAIKDHIHPIIVDNTNLSWGEMWPYVRMGFCQRYYIEFVSFPNVIDLQTRYEICRERIPKWKLERMERRYDPHISFWSYYPRLRRMFSAI